MQASEEVVRKLLEEEQKLARSIEHQALQDEELARQILLKEKEQVIKLIALYKETVELLALSQPAFNHPKFKPEWAKIMVKVCKKWQKGYSLYAAL